MNTTPSAPGTCGPSAVAGAEVGAEGDIGRSDFGGGVRREVITRKIEAVNVSQPLFEWDPAWRVSIRQITYMSVALVIPRYPVTGNQEDQRVRSDVWEMESENGE
jgi:hypothetical protein